MPKPFPGSRLILIWLLTQLEGQELEAIEVQNGDMLIGFWGHWTYFFSDREYFHLGKDATPHLVTLTDLQKRNLQQMPMYCFTKYRIPDTMRKDGEDVPRIGEVGRRLARRMHNVQMYTHPFRCHCKHYVEYITYGTTFGSFYKLSHLPINEKCPLHTRVTSSTDVDAPDFLLTNAEGKSYRLPPYQPHAPQRSYSPLHSSSSSDSGPEECRINF